MLEILCPVCQRIMSVTDWYKHGKGETCEKRPPNPLSHLYREPTPARASP